MKCKKEIDITTTAFTRDNELGAWHHEEVVLASGEITAVSISDTQPDLTDQQQHKHMQSDNNL